MCFKIQRIADNSVIEILSMNIDNEHNILVIQDGELGILKLEDFKDMILGTSKLNSHDSVKEPTYRLIK